MRPIGKIITGILLNLIPNNIRKKPVLARRKDKIILIGYRNATNVNTIIQNSRSPNLLGQILIVFENFQQFRNFKGTPILIIINIWIKIIKILLTNKAPNFITSIITKPPNCNFRPNIRNNNRRKINRTVCNLTHITTAFFLNRTQIMQYGLLDLSRIRLGRIIKANGLLHFLQVILRMRLKLLLQISPAIMHLAKTRPNRVKWKNIGIIELRKEILTRKGLR